ncbi:MAG: SdrD B-like domain-containing protein, partial [Anaerolineales bacterium]
DESSTNGRLYDWGNPIFPANQLTDQVLVGWAQGCTNESLDGICEDPGDNVTYEFSRSVVWVTPVDDTILYVDNNGSGVDCSASPSPTGAEQTINASALVSYRITDDPTTANKVRDDFSSQNYSLNTGTQNWSTSWDETGDNDLPGSGNILITNGTLRIRDAGSIGDTIERQANLSGQVFSDLTFQLTSSGNLDPDDELAVDVSSDSGATWRTLATFKDDPVVNNIAIIMSPYNASNSRVRFRQVNDLISGEYWNIDQVQIKYAPDGDYDMTGARILTCDGTPFAAAYGQDPALSGSNDEEALDLGTGISPLGTFLILDKSVDKDKVPVGGEVTYTYEVENLGEVALSTITVTDNKCSPAVYVSGDTNEDDLLAPEGAETWIFTCSSNIFVDTINVAYAQGWFGLIPVFSAPDEEEVIVIPAAAIGNYIWLDEDGDGDQDAGEAGIPNVEVTLTGNDEDGNPISLTTYTDANGGYLFDGLPPSDSSGYTITVTPPAGLVQTYDEDGLGTLNNSTTTVVAGEEHLTADFGYNWTSPSDTNSPDADSTGAIGDRVWIDADGDGLQDPGEAGLGGVTVDLYTAGADGIFGTSDDVLAATTTTDAAGNYIFDNLDPDAYVVKVTPPAGYTQTGDPDATLDNQTTSPILLAPGDVYVNADFGYNPSGDSSTIGDTIWLDEDVDEVQDVGEAGIPGVTVALILDDGDDVYEPGIDKIIATDITDEIGQYFFPDLPAGTYFVEVTDTENVLGELAPTYDADGGLNERSKVIVDGVNDNLLQDFGYAPPGQSPGEGLIGDQIWLDRDGGNTYDPGEGLEGVRVILTDPGADGILGTADDYTRDTFTDENGNYYFGNLEPSLTYEVTVDTSTLPAGVTNIYDPDSTLDSTTVVNLEAENGIYLDADFGYAVSENPNTISGTIWEDTDADGTLEGGESGRFAGVTVVLYDSNGNIIATTTTDSNGDYSFTGLPDGTYTVDVTDDNNILNGYWHSDGPNDGADNNSQDDTYTISVSGGETNTTADFGYYIEPAALGNFIWDDQNNNGIQDSGEPGFEGIEVTLTITYPNGESVEVTTTTDANGLYSFENLLLDEDYNGSGSGEPTYKLSVEVPDLYNLSEPNASGSTDANDSDGVLEEGLSVVTIGVSPNLSGLVQGSANWDYDFGFTNNPTSVELLWFKVDCVGNEVYITWESLSEVNNLGFNLYRSEGLEGTKVLVTFIPSASPGLDQGATYQHVDGDVSFGVTYVYWLEDLDLDRNPKNTYGPERALWWHFYIPVTFGR